jgi:osmotically-inducible protein OsmY
MSAVHLSPAHALSDDALRQRIEEQARNDKRLEGTRVVVAVQDGGVVLYGSVWLYSQKMLYEHITWRTYGVVEVDNEIHVEPRVLVSDQEIESTILSMILKYQRLQGAGIRVTVTKGHVRLHGTFHNPGDVLFLKHRVAEIAGVIHIEIEVRFVV